MDGFLPRLSRVGILELPDNGASPPRRHPAWLRAAALVLLAIFASVVVVTTAESLGAYCLTTDAGSVPAAR
ncbi:MAG: hypothetical protein NVS2B9_03960 [Myxococcales bacterium]